MELLKYAYESLKEVNAQNICIYKTKENNPFYDYIIVATAIADRQLDALANKVYAKSLEHKFTVRGVEGRGGGSWLLVDLVDVVINIFTLEERAHYDLDKLFALYEKIDLKTLE